MKFNELQINDKFTIEGKQNEYVKIAFRGQSCCTPPHNAFYQREDGKGRVVEKIEDEQEVVKVG